MRGNKSKTEGSSQKCAQRDLGRNIERFFCWSFQMLTTLLATFKIFSIRLVNVTCVNANLHWV